MPIVSPFFHSEDEDYLGYDPGVKRRQARRAALEASHEQHLVPRCDLFDHKDGTMTTCILEIPGCKKNEIDISVHGNKLTLQGKLDPLPEMHQEKSNIRVAERCYGPWQRTINIPPGLTSDQIKAHYSDNGLLVLTYPRKSKSAEVQTVKLT